ncbi:MAG: sel1 repeat family protein [Bacteroidales bacterium]|nr:sel1 repeat family protein [Bacteroidales bacterium]
MNIEEYKIKAQEGSAKAQCALGIFYFKGENGVQKDYKQACYWLEKASE